MERQAHRSRRRKLLQRRGSSCYWTSLYPGRVHACTPQRLQRSSCCCSDHSILQHYTLRFYLRSPSVVAHSVAHVPPHSEWCKSHFAIAGICQFASLHLFVLSMYIYVNQRKAYQVTIKFAHRTQSDFPPNLYLNKILYFK